MGMVAVVWGLGFIGVRPESGRVLWTGGSACMRETVRKDLHTIHSTNNYNQQVTHTNQLLYWHPTRAPLQA